MSDVKRELIPLHRCNIIKGSIAIVVNISKSSSLSDRSGRAFTFLFTSSQI